MIFLVILLATKLTIISGVVFKKIQIVINFDRKSFKEIFMYYSIFHFITETNCEK